MSHYKPYPAYRDSGVEWIGQVPEHWARASIKHILSAPITDGPHETPVFLNEGVEFLSVDGIQDGELVFEGKRFISYEDHARFCKKAKPKINDVLVGKSASVGKVARVKTSNDFNVWSPLAILRSDPTKCNPAYLEFALKADSAQQQILLAGNTSTQANIGMDRLASVGIPLPPITEQHQLTKAIEQETARIEALITKKTRFIELLKEKRQALITHVVTKGLDPNVKLRDSGAKWLGGIPEHWDFVPSNSLFPESKERAWADDEHLSATQKYGVIPLAEYERLEERQVTHAVKNLDQRKHAEVGDFVISMRSFEGGIERVKARGCVRSSYVVLKASENAHIGFFTYLFKSGAYIQGLQATATFIRDGQDLSYNNFRQVKLPRPSRAEQKSIADFLDKSVSRIDGLTEKTQRSIDLLKERRAAFITAAVNGQIDLRESA